MAITTQWTRHKCKKFKKILRDGKVIGYLQEMAKGWTVGGDIVRGQWTTFVGSPHRNAMDCYDTEFDAIKAWCIANKICYPTE